MTDLHTLGLLWIKRALRDLMIIINAVRGGKAITAQRAALWKAIMRRMRNHSEVVQCVVGSEAGKLWRFRLDGAATLSYSSQHAIGVLKEWALLAEHEAKQRVMDLARAASRKWWQWVDEQMRTGAGALHKFCKRDEQMCKAPHPVAVDGSVSDDLTLGIQAMLNADRETWKEVWEKFAHDATTPWREDCSCPWAAELPRITGTEVARAGRKFKKHTGLGCDSFRPQWLSWLSDELLDQYARMLMVIESLGCWPQMMAPRWQ